MQRINIENDDLRNNCVLGNKDARRCFACENCIQKGTFHGRIDWVMCKGKIKEDVFGEPIKIKEITLGVIKVPKNY